MAKKKIIILDDHPLIMQGVKQLLENNSQFEIAAMVTSFEALMIALDSPFDILMLDLNIKGKSSLKWVAEIKFKQPALKILVFSSYNTPSTVKKAFQQKIAGYILKDVDHNELLKALETIANQQYYKDPRLVVDRKGPKQRLHQDFADDFIKKAALTSREEEIMFAIVEGLENQTIAKRLFISPHTVQTHRKRLFKKLNVHSAAELVKFVLRNRSGDT